jgi:hypothetical protein
MCDEGGYEESAPTATSDRVCARWTVCSGGKWPSNTADSQGDFLSLPGEVSKGTYKTRAPTSTNDRARTRRTS